jgi:hypothetical protein
VTCYTQPCKQYKVTCLLHYPPLGDESSPRGGWGICALALPEVLAGLIKAIKGLTYQFDGQKYHSMALHQSKKRFYNLYQGQEMTNALSKLLTNSEGTI